MFTGELRERCRDGSDRTRDNRSEWRTLGACDETRERASLPKAVVVSKNSRKRMRRPLLVRQKGQDLVGFFGSGVESVFDWTLTRLRLRNDLESAEANVMDNGRFTLESFPRRILEAEARRKRR